MTKILWQARSPVVYSSFKKGVLDPAASGGNAYDYTAAKILSEQFDVEMNEQAVGRPGESKFRYWRRMSEFKTDAEIIINESYAVVFGKTNSGVHSVAMIHHIYDDLGKNSLRHKWFFYRLKRRLQLMDLIITVSEYWKNYLEEIGCKNVKVIYNSFSPDEYEIAENDVKAFRKKMDLDESKPLVYIGNAHRQKGVYETYEALKDKGYELIMTGVKNYAADLPVRFVSLTRREYVCLLHAADLVITFSQMPEGWNRIAHEALLCKTPVIGSGAAGMRELLENAGQEIAKNGDELAKKAGEVLSHADRYARLGYDYVKKFDMKYFSNAWISAMNGLINKKKEG